MEEEQVLLMEQKQSGDYVLQKLEEHSGIFDKQIIDGEKFIDGDGAEKSEIEVEKMSVLSAESEPKLEMS